MDQNSNDSSSNQASRLPYWYNSSLQKQPMIGDVFGKRQRQLTEKEIIVMRECMKESFWSRSVPLCIAASFAISAGFKSGFFKPGPPQLKVLYYGGAILTAHIIGKISYLGPCLRKLEKLRENEPSDGLLLDQNARDHFTGVRMPELQRDDMHLRPHEDTQIYHNPEYLTPSTVPQVVEGGVPPAISNPPNNSFTSYDDLRRRNREEYRMKTGQATFDPRYAQPAPRQPYPQQPYYSNSQNQGAPVAQSEPSQSPYQPIEAASYPQKRFSKDRFQQNSSVGPRTDSDNRRIGDSGKYKDEGFS